VNVSIMGQVRRYAAAGWRKRWWAVAAAWLVCLAGWTAVHALPDQYQARARIFADADAVLGSLLRGIALDSSPAGQVETLQRTLLSRPNLELIVDGTGLRERIVGGLGREALVQRLARDVRLTSYARNLFSIEYRDRDPQVAFEVVQKAVQLFLEAATGSDREQYNKAQQFLDEQIALYEGRLREAEQRRATFRTRYIDLLPSETGGASRLEASRNQVRQLQGELEDARNRRDLIRQQLDAQPQTLSAEAAAAVEGRGSRLAEAERQLRELRLRYTEQHPDVAAARALVAELRAHGSGEAAARTPVPRGGASSRPNPLYEQLKVRLVDADAQVASLERQLRDGEAEVVRLEAALRTEPEVQAQAINLDRDYNVLRRNFEELLARRESIRIADAARTGSDRVQLEVVDPPTVPTMPSGPNRRLFDAVVLLLGLGAGGAVGFLLVQLDGSFYSVQDLRRIGLPVLGGISAPGRQPAERLRTIAAFGAACLLLLVAFGAVVIGPSLLGGGTVA
jgi:polysaccharide chain length determinant protein (PEP-CTERM system associated)